MKLLRQELATVVGFLTLIGFWLYGSAVLPQTAPLGVAVTAFVFLVAIMLWCGSDDLIDQSLGDGRRSAGHEPERIGSTGSDGDSGVFWNKNVCPRTHSPHHTGRKTGIG